MKRNGGWCKCAAWAAVAMLPVLGLWAAEPSSELPRDRLEDRLQRIRSQLKNLKVRYRGNPKSVGGGGGAQSPRTPGLECCLSNLKHIDKRLKELTETLDELDQCYRRAADPDGPVATGLARSGAVSFRRALETFANAPSRTEADGAHGLVIRTFLSLVDDVEALPRCERFGESAVAGPDDDGDDAEAPDDP